MIAALLLACSSVVGVAQAAEKSTEPVPRFVTLRADDVNLRTGPGMRYPVEWVYHRKGLPVEIVAQFDEWRQIRDSQGTEGWVQQRMVTGARNVVIQGGQHILRQSADAGATPVARLDPGVIAHLLECRDAWCRIEIQSASSDVTGWLGRGDIWGVLPDEVVK